MGVKPGIYREPINGHTTEYFEGAEVVPPGYEWIATSEDFHAGKVPPFKAADRFASRPQPDGETELVQKSEDDEKAQKTAPNKARASAPNKGA